MDKPIGEPQVYKDVAHYGECKCGHKFYLGKLTQELMKTGYTKLKCGECGKLLTI